MGKRKKALEEQKRKKKRKKPGKGKERGQIRKKTRKKLEEAGFKQHVGPSPDLIKRTKDGFITVEAKKSKGSSAVVYTEQLKKISKINRQKDLKGKKVKGNYYLFNIKGEEYLVPTEKLKEYAEKEKEEKVGKWNLDSKGRRKLEKIQQLRYSKFREKEFQKARKDIEEKHGDPFVRINKEDAKKLAVDKEKAKEILEKE